MLDHTVETVMSADMWTIEVTKIVCDVWAKQAFHRPKDRANGITMLVRRRSDFDARVAATATLIETAALRLAQPGELTDNEYKAFLLRPLHAQLPFLEASVRAELARSLVTLHAAMAPSSVGCVSGVAEAMT